MSTEECKDIIENAIKKRIEDTTTVSLTFSMKDGKSFTVYADVKNAHAFAAFIDELIESIKKKTREDIEARDLEFAGTDFIKKQGKCRNCGKETLVSISKATNIAICKQCVAPILKNRHDLISAFGWARSDY